MAHLAQNLKRTTAWLLVAVLPLLNACVKGGSIGSDGSGSSSGGTITVTKVFPTAAGSNWTPITDPGPLYYIIGSSLTITGTCTRGIATVQVNEGSSPAYAEVGTCDVNGRFSWTHAYTAGLEATKVLTITAYDVTSTAVSGGTATATVHMDDVPPNVVTFTTPGNSPFQYTGANNVFAMQGTCPADVVKITYSTPTGPTITPTGNAWTYNVTLTPGITNHENFYTYDKAGNVSVSALMDISWAPSVTLRAWAVNGGGLVYTGGGSSGPSLESTISAFSGTASQFIYSGGTKHIDMGISFNGITNFARGN